MQIEERFKELKDKINEKVPHGHHGFAGGV